MKTLAAVAKLYRGVAILETMEGFVIIGEDGRQFEFRSRGEAEAFVDAAIVAMQRVMILGEAVTQ